MNEQFETLFNKVNLPHTNGDSAYTVTGSDLQMFAELIVRECATLAYDGPSGILEHFGVQDPDVPTEDEAAAAYERLVALGIIRPYERTLEGAEKDSVYEIILQSIPHSVSNNQRSITEEYTVSGKRYDLHWFGKNDYMIVEITK